MKIVSSKSTDKPLVDAPYMTAIDAVRDRFQAIAGDAGLDWQAEALFALQACQKNRYLAGVATANPLSLQMALLSAAATGVTLNPALALAFLVPRKNEVVMDVSYRGLIKIATDAGSISWAKAELVYEADHFVYRGVATPPVHRCDPFAENRGPLKGGYCLAKIEGGYLVEVMSASEIYQVRDTSEAYKAYLADNKRTCPWVTWEGELVKKTLIKRASKTWPKAPRRLAETINYLNEKLGEGFVDATAVNIPDEMQCGQTAETGDAKQAKPTTVDESRIETEIKILVQKVVERASETGSWEAAREYLACKMSGPELAWARQEVRRAEEAASAS